VEDRSVASVRPPQPGTDSPQARRDELDETLALARGLAERLDAGSHRSHELRLASALAHDVVELLEENPTDDAEVPA
jgi:hypothetical protein